MNKSEQNAKIDVSALIIDLSERIPDPQPVAKPGKEYKRTFGIDNINGVQIQLDIAPNCSFDGQSWTVHDDEIRLSIFDIGEYDDRTGEWEDNPYVMCSADGVSWLTFTPQQARQLAHKLLRIAGKCRTAAQIDRSDPELLETSPRANGIYGKYGHRPRKSPQTPIESGN